MVARKINGAFSAARCSVLRVAQVAEGYLCGEATRGRAFVINPDRPTRQAFCLLWVTRTLL